MFCNYSLSPLYDQYSDWFPILAGVRQGGILSPNFYCIYVDNLVRILKSLNIGCYIFDFFAAALLYADDVAILAPSLKGMSNLLRICENYCADWDICLNAKKSRIMYYGNRISNCTNVTLNGKVIDWAEQWSYLGVTLKSGKTFNHTITDLISKFYRCVNYIFRIDGYSNNVVMLRLIDSHCMVG